MPKKRAKQCGLQSFLHFVFESFIIHIVIYMKSMNKFVVYMNYVMRTAESVIHVCRMVFFSSSCFSFSLLDVLCDLSFDLQSHTELVMQSSFHSPLDFSEKCKRHFLHFAIPVFPLIFRSLFYSFIWHWFAFISP